MKRDLRIIQLLSDTRYLVTIDGRIYKQTKQGTNREVGYRDKVGKVFIRYKGTQLSRTRIIWFKFSGCSNLDRNVCHIDGTVCNDAYQNLRVLEEKQTSKNRTKKTINKCAWCQKNAKRKYCSRECCGLSFRHKPIMLWKTGKHAGWIGKKATLSNTIRQYLKSVRGSACSVCGWDKYHPIDGRSLTEIDHIDGNAKNCHESNRRILCPNCHSEISTFRARNKNSSRQRS